MRLLNVHSLILREFRAGSIPKYAITSHRWIEDEEASMKDIQDGLDLSKSGHRKVKTFAEYVASNIKDVDWIWHDTCCIDKSSSQDVSTSINSMFSWYLNAEVCLAYLYDVPNAEDIEKYSTSAWFKRGWTLQELLAPHLVVFLAGDWTIIGHKGGDGLGKSGSLQQTGQSLTPRISAITQIPESVLKSYTESQQFDSMVKMKWSEGRQTTLEEDMVYCMLGLFDITMPILYGEGESKARGRLLRKIGKSQAMPIRNGPEVNATAGCSLPRTVRPKHLPFRKNPKFVGRTDELEALESKFFAEADCQSMALVGLGGIGKTQVAISFAHSVISKYPDYSVFWVSALSMETFEQSLGEIGRICSIDQASDSKQDVKLLVKRHLSSDAAGSWLLIVDNIDDADLLEGSAQEEGILDYLPGSISGLTLFTTRSLEVAQTLVGSDVVVMERMGHEEALVLLAKSLTAKQATGDDAATADLLIQLDYLPLALTQAAAYMNVNSISVPEYVSLLNGTDQDLVHIMSIEIRDRTRYKQAANAVATTWIVSFKQIAERDPIAADLLKYMSWIEWKAIPHSILPRVNSQAQMTSAIGRLCSYSFLTKRSEGRMYDMHRLVHLAIRVWIEQNQEVDETRENAMHTLWDVFPSYDWANRQIWREQSSHVARICRNGQCDFLDETSGLYLNVGQFLHLDGRTKEAQAWLEKANNLRVELAGDHHDLLSSQHALATVYLDNGRNEDALRLLEHVASREEGLAENDPGRLAAQHTLAWAYLSNGQINSAVRLQEHVVQIQGKVLGEDHPDQLVSQNQLARIYLEDRQVKKAVELLEHVVKIEGKILAEDYPDRLVSQHELARAYLQDGRVEEAVRLLEHVVQIQGKVLAEDHPRRLISQHELARAYLSTGDRQVEKAVRLLEHVVQIREEVLAEDHPYRLGSQHELARAYLTDGQVEKAVGLLEHVVQIEGKIRAEDHPYRLASQYVLAKALLADGRDGQVEKAVELLEHIVRVEGEVLAEDDPERLIAQELLQKAYQAAGRSGNASDEVRESGTDQRRRASI